MFKGIHHTAISTRNLELLIGFYRDLFGFEVEFDFPWDAENEAFQRTHAKPRTSGRVVMLRHGSARLELFEYEEPVPRPDIEERENADLGIAHFSFEVEDIEAEFERLRAAGMSFQSELVAQANVKNVYGRDPDGNLIELIEFFDAPVA